MKLKYPVCRDCTEFEDLAPRNGSNKPDTLLLVGTVAMIVMCGLIFISVVLMGY